MLIQQRRMPKLTLRPRFLCCFGCGVPPSRGRRKSCCGHLLPIHMTKKLNLTLTKSSEQLREMFWALKHPQDIADMLDVPYGAFNYWIYRTPETRRYTTFHIPKKSGLPRRIDVPNTNIKILQRKLKQVLQSIYFAKPSVHGFVPGKNVKSNALRHVGKRWVFNGRLGGVLSLN